jgi:hypothetical protein
MLGRLLSRYPGVARVVESWVGPPKLSQEGLDFYNASVLILCHQHLKHTNKTAEGIRPEQLQSYYDKVDGMSKSARQEFVDAHINKEILKMFTGIHELTQRKGADIKMIYEVVSSPSAADSPVAIPSDKYKHRAARRSRAIQEEEVPKAAPVIDWTQNTDTIESMIGFELRLKASNISGDGVFLSKGKLLPGAIVGMFPGTLHLLDHLSPTYLEDRGLLPDENLMLMVRTDGHIIDGRTAGMNNFNPFAQGHMINHPPKGSTPNVMAIKYDFPEDPLGFRAFPNHLRTYIPNKYADPPSLMGVLQL